MAKEIMVHLDAAEVRRLEEYRDMLNRQSHGREYDLATALKFIVTQELRPRQVSLTDFWMKTGRGTPPIRD